MIYLATFAVTHYVVKLSKGYDKLTMHTFQRKKNKQYKKNYQLFGYCATCSRKNINTNLNQQNFISRLVGLGAEFTVTSCRSNGSDSTPRRRRTYHSTVFARWHQRAPPSNIHGSLVHASLPRNGISIGSSIFAGVPIAQQTDTQKIIRHDVHRNSPHPYSAKIPTQLNFSVW